MRVLVAAASKHGATSEIAEAIGTTLAAEGHDPEVVDITEVEGIEGFDAAVIGSAVYAGHWMESARRVIERLGEELTEIPVWVFSSGPIGDPPKPAEEPVDVDWVVDRVHARGHHVFAGKLDKEALGFGERAIAAALRAPAGDFRDWEDVETWAKEIASELG